MSLVEPLTIEYDGFFHLFTTVGTLNLHGYDILCIPEEYMTDQETFYAPYFKKKQTQMSTLINNVLNIAYSLKYNADYRDWETDRKSTRLNSSHSAKSRMPSSA